MFWKTLLNETHIMPTLGTCGSLIKRSALYRVNQGTAETTTGITVVSQIWLYL